MGLADAKKAVIFDLDGTIVDSLSVWSRVDVLLAQALGVDNPDPLMLHRIREDALERFKNKSQPYTELCGEFGRVFGSLLSAEEIHAMRFRISREVLKNDVRLRDGADEAIRKLTQKGKRLAIVTTTKRANVKIYSEVNQHICSKIHLTDYFPVVVTMEDVENIKPDPQGYQLALQKLGVRAKEALVVEDSRVGVMAARAAGIEVAVIREPFSEANRPWIIKHAQYYYILS